MKTQEFHLKLSDEEVLYTKIIYFADSLFIYIGDKSLEMNNAYLAIQTKYVCSIIFFAVKFIGYDSQCT